MKKLLVMMAFVLIAVTSAFGQFYIGPKIGFNFSNVRFNSENGEDYRMGAVGGIFLNWRINKFLDLQTEAMYSGQGYNFNTYFVTPEGHEVGKVKFKYKTHYLNIPILIKFFPWEGFHLETGPQVGFQVGSKLSYDEDELSAVGIGSEIIRKPGTNVPDFSFVFGVGYDFKCGITSSVRYNLGISDCMKDTKDSKNRVFQLALGYKFKI